MKKLLTTLAAAAALTFLPVAAASANSNDSWGNGNNDRWQSHANRINYSPTSYQHQAGGWNGQSANDWQLDMQEQGSTVAFEYLAVQVNYVKYNSSTSSYSNSASSNSSNNFGGYGNYKNASVQY